MQFDRIKRVLLRIKYKGRITGSSYQLRKNASIKVSRHGMVHLGRVLLNENVFICSSDRGQISIEDGVTINRNTIIVSKKDVSIGEGTSIGPNVCIYDHDHVVRSSGFQKNEFNAESIKIGKNVWIAANVIILKGSIIGDNCVVGAGTIIKGVVPENHLVYNERHLYVKQLQ